jgi:hypothetical protein
VAVPDPVGAGLAEWLSKVETLQALAQKLKAISRTRNDSELSEIAAALIISVVGLSWQLTLESESFSLTTQQYADRLGISQRSAQRLCSNHRVPAILADDGTWRIKDA